MIAWRYHIAFRTSLKTDETLIPCGRRQCFALVLPTRIHEEPELNSPVIESNEKIFSSYNIFEPTLLILEKLKIKYISIGNSKNNLVQYLNNKSTSDQNRTNEENKDFVNKLNQLKYFDLKDETVVKFSDIYNNKKTLLYLSISGCLSCPDAEHVNIIKGVFNKHGKNVNIIMLFGRSNKSILINEFIERMQLNGFPIKIGIIDKTSIINEIDYYSLFKLDVDPRLIVIDEKEQLLYLENHEKNERVSAYKILALFKNAVL